MGTEITLDIGKLTLVYNKNQIGWDHGALFQEKDRKRLPSDAINYEYFEENKKDPGPMEMAFVRPLREVIPRLEMLGFTPEFARKEYERCSSGWREHSKAMAEYDDSPAPCLDLMSFDEFCSFAVEHAVEDLDGTFAYTDHVKDEDIVHGRFKDDGRLARLPHFSHYDHSSYSERSYFGNLINILHPYSVLRILGGNARNLETPLVWQYGPLVEAGWATADEFISNARRTETFLIATEGSSDVHILKHALALLKPEIADFFRFIDVTESHPFSGAGNLLKFAEGLAKIDVHNHVIFVFDNDAEGYSAFQRLEKLQLPINMRAMLLPELEAFRSFSVRGPEGISAADINRRAAGIECYLDLGFENASPPRVLWTTYKTDLDLYQGALERKEGYVKDFLKQTPETLKAGAYDTNKLKAVLDALEARCSSMRMDIESAGQPFEIERD